MLILFAFMLTIFAGMLALIIDLGYAYGQKRISQNVADNAALAGTEMVAKYVDMNSLQQRFKVTNHDVAGAICDVAQHSSGPFFDHARLCAGDGVGDCSASNVDLSATYLGSDGTPLSGGTLDTSNNPPPSDAHGLLVTASEPVPTFFANALPVSGVSCITVSSQAAALVGDDVTSYSTNNENFLGFAVWYQSNPGAQPLAVDQDTYFRSGNWCQAVAPTDLNCDQTASFKGLLFSPDRAPSQVNVGLFQADNGNETDLWDSRILNYCQQSLPLVLPVINRVSAVTDSDGTVHAVVNIVGFVAIFVDTPGGSCDSTTSTGTIAYFGAERGVGTGGPAPAITPSVRRILLTPVAVCCS